MSRTFSATLYKDPSGERGGFNGKDVFIKYTKGRNMVLIIDERFFEDSKLRNVRIPEQITISFARRLKPLGEIT